MTEESAYVFTRISSAVLLDLRDFAANTGRPFRSVMEAATREFLASGEDRPEIDESIGRYMADLAKEGVHLKKVTFQLPKRLVGGVDGLATELGAKKQALYGTAAFNFWGKAHSQRLESIRNFMKASR